MRNQAQHQSRFPKWESQKINPESVSHLSPPKICPFNHHIHHTNHHKFTTKTPRQNTRFLQNPQQNTTNPLAKKTQKNSPENRQVNRRLIWREMHFRQSTFVPDASSKSLSQACRCPHECYTEPTRHEPCFPAQSDAEWVVRNGAPSERRCRSG
jgi:hypothetical protein